MATTQKISVALGKDELRLAKVAAERVGLSLSAFITRAVREKLEEQARLEAAREFLATYTPEERATPQEQRALLASWGVKSRGKSSASRAFKPKKKRRAA